MAVSFKSLGRGGQARQFATRLWEASQGPDAVLEDQRHIHSIPQAPLTRSGTCVDLKDQPQLKAVVKAAHWLSKEAKLGAPDRTAILALLFLSHDSRVALTRLNVRCVGALADKMRGEDRSCTLEDEEYYNYFKLLQALRGLFGALSEDQDDHLQTALRGVTSLAVKFGTLGACSELLASVTPKAGERQMRREEVELVLDAVEWPLQVITHTFKLLREQVPSHRPVDLLIAAIASSNFMEHSARALVLALEAVKGPQETTATGETEPSGSCATVKMLLDKIHVMCFILLALRLSVAEGTTMVAAIKAIMLGPCVQYTVAASIVSTIASVDGGTLYGIATPVTVTRDVLSPLVEVWDWLFEQTPSIKMLLYSPVAVRRVCSRLLNVAVMPVMSESAAQRAAPQKQLEQAASPSRCDPLPALRLALATLRCYARMFPYPLVRNLRFGGGIWGGPGAITDSPEAAAAAVEYWGKAVPTLNALFNCNKADDIAQVDHMSCMVNLDVAVADWADDEPVPPPSPSLTAALAAGYVPLLERTLRALALDHGISPLIVALCDHSRMGALLAYGEPHEVASLLATGAKLLKRLLHSKPEEQIEVLGLLGLYWMWDSLGAEVYAPSERASPVAVGPSCSSAQPGVSLVDVSDGASGKACDGSASGSEGLLKRTSCMSQAASLISTCLPLWLPPLAGLAKLPWLDSMSKTRLSMVLIKSLLWVSAVVAAMEIEEGRLQPPAGCGSSGRFGNIESKGHAFGWRRFLLREWDALGQLGICLQLVASCKSNPDMPKWYTSMLKIVYTGLACLVSLQPGEVAAAIKDGRLPVLTDEQLLHSGAEMPQHDVEKWRNLLSELQGLQNAEDEKFTVEESAVQCVWTDMPQTLKIGSLLVLANRPAATGTAFEGAEVSTSSCRMHGQPPRLRLCANPGCDNLAGDSEATLPLKACGGCGAVWYCRRACQTAHWRAVHKTECGAIRAQSHRPFGS